MYKNSKNEVETVQVPLSIKKFAKDVPHLYKEENVSPERIERLELEFTDFQKRSRKQWNTGKKASVSSLVAVASIALFIGSGFVSPTMAEVISKIPPLSTIYKQVQMESQLTDQLTKLLKEEGYPVNHIAEHVGGKEEGFYVFLEGSDKEISNMEEGIKEAVYSILNQRRYKGTSYESYYVRIAKYEAPSKEWVEEQDRIFKEEIELQEIVHPILEKYDYEHSAGIGKEKIELEFPTIESNERIQEIKSAILHDLHAAGKDNIVVEHTLFNQEKRDHYSRWSDAFSAIAHELKTYKKYKVSSIGYKSKDGVMKILIKIELPSTDPDAQEHSDTLRTMIEEFIHTDEIWGGVKDDPYVIEITSKDDKKLE